MTTPRVVICGGGMGGLTLAHALRDWADVVVLERDAVPEATGGYRLHLDAEACRVLDQHVPAQDMAAIRAASDGPASFRQFTIATRKLRPMIIDEQNPDEDRLLCERVVLRSLLARGLGDRVQFDTTVERVTSQDTHATVHTSDGHEWGADLVVGAEGGLSPTVSALAGEPTALDSGLCGIAGRTPLSAGHRYPTFLTDGPALAVSRRGVGLFLSLSGHAPSPAAASLPASLRPGPSLVWGLICPRTALPEALPTDGRALAIAANDLLVDWYPRIRTAVLDSDPASVAAYPFRGANPLDDLTPWSPGPVTAIGDAVHAMPPTGGRAAATAIRDAGYLASALRRRPATPEGIRVAVADYQHAMPGWAVPAMEESLRVCRLLLATQDHHLRPALAGAAMRVAGALGRLRHG